MEAYPTLVRKRILELYAQAKSTKEIAELFGVSRSGTRRVKQRLRERGTVEPLPRRSGRKPKLTPELATEIRTHVAAHADATRDELKHALGLTVSVQTVGEWLRKLGLVLKKSRSTPPSRTGPTSGRGATPGGTSWAASSRAGSCSSTRAGPRRT
jgi:transposase